MLVDDDQPALEELIAQLNKYPEIIIVDAFTDPVAAHTAIRETPPQILFLDIDMPGLNGLEMARSIQLDYPELRIVFVSAYQQYALQAFEIHALDYLLKPISDSRMEKTVARIQQDFSFRRRKPQSQETIAIRCFGKFEIYKLVHTKEILRWRTQKAKELFLYLLLNYRRTVSKTELIQALFGESENRKAYNNLYVTMYYLRKTFEDFGINRSMLVIRDDYSLHIAEGICDFIDLLNCAEIRPTASEAEISRYAELLLHYEGAFLQEEDYPWSLEMREHLEVKYEKLILELTGAYLARQRSGNAEILLNRLLEYNPLSEPAYQKLLEIYMLNRQTVEFLALYRKYQEMLQEELAIRPERRFQNHYLALRGEE